MEIMSRLTQKIVHTIIQDADITSRDTCEIHFARIENLEFLEHAFIETLQQLFPYVRVHSPASEHSVRLDVQPSRADVVYEKTFQEGLFDEKKAVRVISVEFSAKVVKKPEGNVVFAGVRKEQFRDTVHLSSIDRLESPILKATQASLPSGSLFDRFVEPLVVLAATGVVIYLFFTVRS